jgi:Flp pilus assembly protein TadD
VRKDLLATAFALGSLLLYLRGRGEERTEDGLSVPSWRARAILLQVVSCGLFAAAVLSKEGTIALLAVIFVYEFLLRSDDLSHRVLNSIVPTLPYLGVGIVFLAVYFWIGHGHGALPSYHEGGRWATAVLMTKGFAYYLLLLFFPVHLCADYNTFGAGGVDAWFMLSAAALVGVAALTWALYRRMPLAAFGVVWFFVCLAPVSNVIPIAARISERYLYLPLVGFCIAVAAAMSAIPRRRMTVPSVLLCVLLALFCALTAQRAADWTSDRRLWGSALRSYPDSPRANYSLGHLFHKRLVASSPEERRSPDAAPVLRRADFHFRKAVEADPKYAKALCGLAHVALDRGDGPGSLKLLERAISAQPHDAVIRHDYANVLARVGMREAAIKHYIEAARNSPNDPEIVRDLGRVSLADGHAQSALLAFNRVREMCPTMPAIYSDIGNANLALGRFAEAAVALERALQESPDDARVAHNLSYAYQQLGDVEKAKALEQALPRARPRQ